MGGAVVDNVAADKATSVAEQAVSSPAESPVSAIQTTAASFNAEGGRERELTPARPEKADDAKRGDSPPGITADGEVADMAQYDAWQSEQDKRHQQAMQRREEVNINPGHLRRERDVVAQGEQGDDF